MADCSNVLFNCQAKAASLDKLYNQQDKEWLSTQHRLKEFTRFREDYEALRVRLSTIADRVSHEVMVPVGRLAFFPGRVVHTNEILVLLGDNWFAQRSAKQAGEIVTRRIQKCDEMIHSLQEEVKLHDSWKQQTKILRDELSDGTRGVEIVEEEKPGWREKHREAVKRHSEERKKQKALEQAEKDLWARLDELELEEELQDAKDLLGEEEESDEEEYDEEDEESGVGSDNEEPEQQPDQRELNEKRADQVSKQEQADQVSKQEQEGQESKQKQADPELKSSEAVKESETRTGPGTTPNNSRSQSEDRKRVTWSPSDSVLRFDKKQQIISESDSTLRLTFQHSSFKASHQPPPTSAETAATSPAEIFDKFCLSQDPGQFPAKKSILKVRTPTPVRPQPSSSSLGTVPAFCDTPLSYSQHRVDAGEVVERQRAVPDAQPDAQPPAHRPVSRFKASRQASK